MTAAAPRIGWIGAGVMGAPMAGHLLAAGHDVVVHTRTRARADELLRAGAHWADTPAAAAAGADVVFTMLGHPADVREVVLGAGGVLERLKAGAMLIDMTTSEPRLAVEIHEAAAERGVAALDAPVSGGDVGARNATLAIMIGGAADAFQRALPLLRAIGETVALQGGPGAGQHTKMVNQIAIAGNVVGVCEALLYAHRAGLDVERALETIATGAAGSWTLSNLGPRILRGDLEPGFRVEHFLKDLGIALAEARSRGLRLPGLALAEQLYADAAAQGLGQRGTQALALALARASDVNWLAVASTDRG